MPFRSYIYAASGLLLMFSNAMAWETVTDEDPMDDTKIAVIAQDAEGSNDFSAISLGFKCWQGKPDEMLLFVSTLETWDNSASYPVLTPVKIRVDKNAPIEIQIAPRNMNGLFAATISSGVSPNIIDLLRQLSVAKKSIGMEYAATVFRFTAKGSTTSVSKFVETCGLTLPTQ